MVIETSALVAIALGEPGHEELRRKLRETQGLLPASCLLEAHQVLTGRLGEKGPKRMQRVMELAGIVVVPVSPEAAREACRAFDRYGRGQGHAAKLNFGDCLSYGVAASTGRPLLFVGDDFALTDVRRA